MSTALIIADEVLKISKRKAIDITPMQLMKLVYISHGWALAMLERGLFDNRIEAWKYGPVIPDLYQATKQFGREKIPLHLIKEDEDSGLDQDTKDFLKEVVSKYGHLNGVQLSNLTHMPGTPWHQVYEPDVLGKEIPKQLIQGHYQAKLNDYKAQSSTAPK